MYIILEKFDKPFGIIKIVMDKVNRGRIKLFKLEEEAKNFAYEECVDGQVVDIGN